MRFDKNKKGYLDEKEFEEALLSIDMFIKKNQIKKIYKETKDTLKES